MKPQPCSYKLDIPRLGSRILRKPHSPKETPFANAVPLLETEHESLWAQLGEAASITFIQYRNLPVTLVHTPCLTMSSTWDDEFLVCHSKKELAQQFCVIEEWVCRELCQSSSIHDHWATMVAVDSMSRSTVNLAADNGEK